MAPMRSPLVAVLLAPLAGCGACTPDVVHPEAIRRADLGVQYLNNGQCIQGEESCRLALEYGPNFEHPYNCLGMVELTCRNDLEKAKAYFKDALAVNADFAEAHNNLGAVFFRENPPNYDAACDEFKASIEIDPGYGDGRENFGMCLLRQGKIAGDRGDKDLQKTRYTEARSHFIRLLEQNPNNFNARHHLGLMDMDEQKFESAEQNFRRCLESDPENSMCCYNLGTLFLTTERCDQAIQQFICSLRSGVESEVSILARKNLGTAYEACAKKDGAILKFLDKIKQDPGNPAHHYDLGGVYAEKGLSDQAVNEWENTVKLDPTYCPAYYELSMVANKNLDSAVTIRRCQDYVACITEKSRNEPVDQFAERVDRCKTLVKKLEME
mgnify:CR=1 FL=1|jgi:tetratricopeptide (TPR) repeat protein